MSGADITSVVEFDEEAFDGASIRDVDGRLVAVIDPDGNIDRETAEVFALGIIFGDEMLRALVEVHQAIDARRGHLPPATVAVLDRCARHVARVLDRWKETKQ